MAQTCTPETKRSSQGKGEGDSDRLQSFCFQLEKEATVDRPGLFLHKQLRGKCCSSLILYKLQIGLVKCTPVYKWTITAALSNQPLLCCQLAPSHPSPFTIIQYLKESYQFAIIQEQSSKPLITPWPCNPWPFTLLLLTHCCYPILPRRFGVRHASQGRKPGSLFMPFFL